MEKYLEITEKLIKSLEDSSLDVLEFKLDNFSLKIGKNSFFENNLQESVKENNKNFEAKKVINDAKVEKKEIVKEEKNIKILKAPVLGVFYSSKSPEADPFVKIGDKVKKGSTLCIIEAMKMMNEIKAPYDCRIVDCLVSNEDFVEYDAEIFKLEQL
ncbi:acetyl-CoA carboxylase biotin carboxyl carrier protein [Anaerococcus sp. AGMB00486]|uniref:Biotin carboxyl carrier protein of acetyl-CoA carboxylase n=2 Tax=Anaerococcus TaxID=165779 RepID=A0ABX2N9V1_9FIRM|nr:MULTISPECIES: acetyl-CoA carboxylase biotin carboxyl carrier protein [Anaerococcus]MDY3006951.1 acetyl-CoA carboxylase biotin carboxyl carrier protein [Anaerococcus porci]MSS78334.1 acetyl-CoA carboxylase biotin carboxyl carrier protein [Anaerococcus porci]NVF11448.1 acetyl-CoA carboxylase biotin carboxyl carrier protein [Anaerococcus faecalis]